MAIWKCPECGCTDVATIESSIITGTYYGDDGIPEVGSHDHPGHEPDILMSAGCDECHYELTNVELAQVATSIDRLVLSGHPRIPIDPNSIEGYVIVNPKHFSGTPIVLRDDPYLWSDYETQLRQMYYLSVEHINEFLYVGMVLKVAGLAQIADKYVICKECGEVYEVTLDKCPECEAWVEMVEADPGNQYK